MVHSVVQSSSSVPVCRFFGTFHESSHLTVTFTGYIICFLLLPLLLPLLLRSACHGSALGDDGLPTPAATTHATTPTTTLGIVAIGRYDLSFHAHSTQDLEALADTAE